MTHSASPSQEDAQKRPSQAASTLAPTQADPAIAPPQALQRFMDGSAAPIQPRDVQRLQRTVGNRQVQRLLQARGHRAGSRPIQPRLTVNAPHDPLEEEADAVAQAVTSETTLAPGVDGPSLHHASPTEGVSETPPDVEVGIETARGSGQPLAEGVRAPMEQAMGADFSRVRVHTDPQADQLSRSLNAHAFTTGEDLFFRDGAFRPQSDEGEELLAHELAHVVQQMEPGVQRRIQRRIDQMPEGYFDNLTPGHLVTLRNLTTYSYVLPVNSRGQTFEEVVTEFLAIFPQENDVKMAWKEFQRLLPANQTEALECLKAISDHINQVVKQHPSYPNPVHDKRVGSDHSDHSHSVPQSERSTNLVTQLHQALKGEDIYKEKYDERGQKTGELSGYMIGVMVGVDGQAYASCSGSPPKGFKTVVEKLGMIFVTVEIDAEMAKQRVLAEAQPHTVRFGTGDDKHRVHDPQSGEMGPTIGQCAAPKLLQALIERGISQGTTPLSLTEMWIAPDDTPVKIPNDKGKVIRYYDGDIVPSCLSCQQLVPLIHETLQDLMLESDQREMEQSEKLSRIKGLLVALHQHMHPPSKETEESSDSPARLPLTEHSPEIEHLQQELQTFGLLEVEDISLPSLNEAIAALREPAQMAEGLRRARARARREQDQQAKKEKKKEERRLEREKQEEEHQRQEEEELRLWKEEQERKKQEEQVALERRQKQQEEHEAARQRKRDKAWEQQVAREQKKREREEKQKSEQEQVAPTPQPQGGAFPTTIAKVLFMVALVVVFLSFLPSLLGNKEQG